MAGVPPDTGSPPRGPIPDVIQPLPGHAVFVLLLQLAAMLALARTLAEVMRRVGQPGVIGELLAGILLGPTILGTVAPAVSAFLFPPLAAQFHLLEVVSWLGMVLLLLLTGLQTDVRAMRNLGRAAFMASVFGMVVPFAGGLALGWALPERYLVDPAGRAIFAAFLATSMAISAIPVIAKILMDLDLIHRNVGMVILSAGVVDDTTGWIILSAIAGIAAGGTFSAGAIPMTLAWLVVFLAVMRWVAHPVLSAAVRWMNEWSGAGGADLTLILGFTFLASAVTEAVGIHAVFGAFIAGVVLRQVPRLRSTSINALELFVLSGLSPIFFAFVGLKVDLWAFTGWRLPALVVGVAIAGKLVGCYVGGRLGRMSHWESLALGFGMNARGGMGLIVAVIGLSLGLLTQEMYAAIVLVAVVTSFMAPFLLRWAMVRIPLGEDERRRIVDTGRQSLIPTTPLRILVPTAGGENAMGAIHLAAPIAGRDQGQVTALYVDTSGAGRKAGLFHRRRGLAGTNIDAHLERAAQVVRGQRGSFLAKRLRAGDLTRAVTEESSRDYDLLFLGAAPERPLQDSLAQHIVHASPVPVVIVSRRQHPDRLPTGMVLVPVDGSLFARYGTELAFAFASATGAEVRVLHVLNAGRLGAGRKGQEREEAQARVREEVHTMEARLREELGPLAEARGVSMSIRVLVDESPVEIIIAESRSGNYDLLVLGAENKMLGQPLFFGQGTAEIMERAGCTTAVVLPARE